jgi:SAM-dependent methyltransferase
MSDQIFAHPRLAAVYDAFDADRGDLPHYAAIASELSAGTVLDVGCGTGSFAVRLAGGGRTVIGVDPAAASLEIARAKGAGLPVTWIHGESGDVPPAVADLAVMTGNVAQVFGTAEAWAANLAGIHRALRPGGHLVFETRRPEARAWEEWAAQTDPVVRDGVERTMVMTGVNLPFVSFQYTFRFPDGTVLTSDSTLRFRSRDEIGSSLAAAGFEVRDVREAPDRPGKEFVFIARRIG